MAVVGSAKRIDSKMHVDAELHRTYTSIYEVLTDSVSDGPLIAQGAVGIPTIGDNYAWGSEVDPWAFCNDGEVSLREVDKTRKLWRIAVQHSTRPRFRSASVGQSPLMSRGSPLDEPPVISGSFAIFTKTAGMDKDGAAITNSAEEQKTIEIDDNRHSLVIEVNTPTISLAQWKAYRASVNSTAIWGLGPRQVKLKQWSWRIMCWGQGNEFVSHHYEFEISYEEIPRGLPAFPEDYTYGWNSYFLDCGFRHVNPDWDIIFPEWYYLTNMDGRDQVLHQARNLDGHGNLLGPGIPPVYRVYQIYGEQDFTLLPGIPNPLPGPFT